MNMKWFAVLGLLLFLGVAVAPSITAQLIEDKQVNPITTEFHGSSGIRSHSIELTEAQMNEVGRLFNDLDEQMKASTSIDEKYQLYINQINSLYNLNVIDSTTQQQLLNQADRWLQLQSIFDKHEHSPNAFPDYTNYFCLIYGSVNPYIFFESYFALAPLQLLGYPFYILAVRLKNYFDGPIADFVYTILLTIEILLYLIPLFLPIKVLNTIVIATNNVDFHTIGLKGEYDIQKYLWLLGYSGLILTDKDKTAHFLGFALGIWW